MSESELLRSSRSRIGPVLERCGFVFPDAATYVPPDDTSYLNDQDRANPDIMANVAAMAATNADIAWLGQYAEGWVGIWRATGHVVRLDTEGQYEILARDVGDFLARAALGYGEPWDDALTGLLAAQGFKVSASLEAALALIADAPDVNGLRDALYVKLRAKDGAS
ncbi:MAG: hypothetical protein EKK41_10365 [Hyphomicrobiales bacterium]|nr:MAG: hypothetical protein EKK41_10365 [Hyphomicrobiales bacterium]